jgi:hypothetical protein
MLQLNNETTKIGGDHLFCLWLEGLIGSNSVFAHSVCVCKRIFAGEDVGDTETIIWSIIAFSDPGLVIAF